MTRYPPLIGAAPERRNPTRPLPPSALAQIIEEAWFAVGCPVTVWVAGGEVRSDLRNGLWRGRSDAQPDL